MVDSSIVQYTNSICQTTHGYDLIFAHAVKLRVEICLPFELTEVLVKSTSHPRFKFVIVLKSSREYAASIGAQAGSWRQPGWKTPASKDVTVKKGEAWTTCSSNIGKIHLSVLCSVATFDLSFPCTPVETMLGETFSQWVKIRPPSVRTLPNGTQTCYDHTSQCLIAKSQTFCKILDERRLQIDVQSFRVRTTKQKLIKYCNCQ